MALHHTLPWVYGVILVAVHYWGEEIAEHPVTRRLTGFSAGVTVSYAFLELLPRFHTGIEHFGSWGFFSLLAGFSLPHVVEAFIIQHENTVEEIRHEYKEAHTAFIFAYYVIIGMLIQFLVERDVLAGTLLFVPVLLHTAISSLSVAELHSDVMENSVVEAVVILSSLAGIGIATLLTLQDAMVHLLLGVVTGLFLYVVISDSISQKAEGDVRLFVLGAGLYSAVIVALWTLP